MCMVIMVVGAVHEPPVRGGIVMGKVSIVGAGAYGSALALYCRRLGYDVSVWCFEKELPQMIKDSGENGLFLPGIKIDPSIVWTNDPKSAVADSDLIILVTPSAYVRSTAKTIAPLIPKKSIIVSATKGIEHGTLALMSQILEEVLSDHADRLCYLSGPSFARDIANGLPADVACASHSIDVARRVQEMLHSPLLRIYANDDIIGTELGGALKNVVAVACGAADQMNMGASAGASLITRGLAEITRLGVAMGAKPISFLGLAGVGDLILTCTGDLSRNRTLGKRIAMGEKIADIISGQKAVAEGYVTAKPAVELAKKYNVDLPLTQAVYRICYENADFRSEAMSLMNRSMKDEFDGM